MSRGLEVLAKTCVGQRPSPIFVSSTEDAGNGTLIRLAALPIFFHGRPMSELLAAARASSYSTHPGPVAAECCAFLAFLLQAALVRQDTGESLRVFIDRISEAYCQILQAEAVADELQAVDSQEDKRIMSARTDLLRLLQSPSVEPEEDSSEWQGTELAWRWRVERTRWCRTLANRGDRYNGYPVSSGYVGSFAMDGLAIALWAAYHTESFDGAIERCVNLQGDADSTTAICGALCGTFYGCSSIHPRIVGAVQQWDKQRDLALRSILLWYLGSNFDGSYKNCEIKPAKGSGGQGAFVCGS